MRRALLKQLPALLTFYPGLKPADLDEMSYREISELITQMEIAHQKAGENV